MKGVGLAFLGSWRLSPTVAKVNPTGSYACAWVTRGAPMALITLAATMAPANQRSREYCTVASLDGRMNRFDVSRRSFGFFTRRCRVPADHLSQLTDR